MIKSLLLQVSTTTSSIDINAMNLDNVWVLFCSFLVFLMHIGFAMLESGLTRSKNTINILYKNSIIPSIGLLTYALIGYGLMYPGFEQGSGGFFGFAGFGIGDHKEGHLTVWSTFIFQALFAATSATIVSGAVAERIKYTSFVIFSIIFVAFVYPIIASWVWGGGWLSNTKFHDFAGSTVVHGVGGAAALAGVAIVGARLGKFNNKMILPLPGHNMSSATLGAFVLWLGWIGFNGGSVLAAQSGSISKVIVITLIGGASGGFFGNFTILAISKKYDLTMLLNGILAGLVACTAGADVMSVTDAVIVGGLGGIIVVPCIFFIESLKLDDPVGAISVHLVGGLWGTIAVGIFSDVASVNQFVIQLLGALICILASFLAALLIFAILRATIGVRVTKEQELTGLDLTAHGMKAYTFVSK